MNNGICIFLMTLAYASSWAFNCKYRFENFEISLKPDNFFTFHQIDAPVRDISSGKYYLYGDSIVLTTHEYNSQEAVLMILVKENDLSVRVIYLQKQLAVSKLIYPIKYFLLEEYYANHEINKRWYWQSYDEGTFELYNYTPEKKLAAIERYHNFLLEGEQVEFFTNSKQPIPKSIQEFKNGVRYGFSIYFTQNSDEVLIEKYRNGKLKNTKTPAILPAFYTSRF
jgi:hypothetical protein